MGGDGPKDGNRSMVRPFAHALLVGWMLFGATSCATAHRESPPPDAEPSPVEPPPRGLSKGRTAWLDIGILVDRDTVSIVPGAREAVLGIPELSAIDGGDSLVVWKAGATLLARVGKPGQRPGREAFVADDTVRVGDSASESIAVNGRRYRGGAKVFVNPRRRLTTANRVALEAYLRGVLPYEIGKLEASTLEAGKAQAVAARTYTLSYVGRRGAEGFDLYDSVEDQVYGGTKSENAWTDRSVQETGGVVALFGGRYIRANYHSTCGGATVNVEDVWPDPAFPWLRQVEDGSVVEAWCRWSPHFRWTEVWSSAEVLADLNQYGPAQSGQSAPLGGWRELRDLRVDSRTPSGRVRELVFETEKGEVVVFADKTRFVLRRPKAAGGGILRSSLFKLAVRRDGAGRITSVVASGAGNGHGAGMCQTGALGQSRAGRRYPDILRLYYRGIELARL